MMPPSPDAIIFTGWKEKTVAKEYLQHPIFSPVGYFAPRAWDASSIISKLNLFFNLLIFFTSQPRPAKWTGTTKFFSLFFFKFYFSKIKI